MEFGDGNEIRKQQMVIQKWGGDAMKGQRNG